MKGLKYMNDVLFRKGDQTFIDENVPLNDGQIIFNETDEAIYVDSTINGTVVRKRYAGGNLSRSDIDMALSTTSENPVANKVVTNAIGDLPSLQTDVKTNLVGAINEVNAHADTAQGNINSEASTRATQDSLLQSQINQIIAPSGEAPSAAEVQNARIGDDGVTYPTLGDAIRTQFSNVKSSLDKSIFDAPLNNLFTTTNQETGVFYNESGVKETYANYNSTTLIPLGNVTKLVVTSPITAAVTFWDSNSTFVSSKRVGVNTQTNVFVPSDAKYYRINWSKTLGWPTVLANSEVQCIEKKIYDRTEQFPLVDIFTVDGRELGGFYNSTGAWEVYEPSGSTKLIEIPVNTSVIRYYSRKGRTVAITFWDSESVFISYVNAWSGINISVPSNAKYIRCAYYRVDDEYPMLLCNTILNTAKYIDQIHYTFNFYGNVLVAQEDAITMPSGRSNAATIIKHNNDLVINCYEKQIVIKPSNISVAHPSDMVADGSFVTIKLDNNSCLLLDVNNNNIFVQSRTVKIPSGCILLASVVNGMLTDGVYSKIINDLESQIYSKDDLCVGGYGVCEFVVDNVASDHTFIDNDLYYFVNNPSDHSAYSLCKVYTVDFVNKTATLKTDFYQNWGHCNTIDYNKGNDCFILGNGSGSETMDYNEFYIIPNASNLADIVDGGQAPLDTYGIKYRVSEWGASSWGKQLNVVWGDSNGNRNDMAYLVSNDGTFMYIRLIQLAKGSNEFTNGTLISGKADSEFNGTWRVVDTWITPYATEVALQGGTYHDGKLYFGYGHDGICYEVFELGINGNVHRERRQFNHYDASGTKISLTTEGLAINNGLLFIGSDSDAEHITYAYRM
jgi:hypothetical protein